MLHKTYKARHHFRKTKIRHKRQIALAVYNEEYYDVEGKYDKGKVHCSCPMCTAKTGGRTNQSRGAVYQGPYLGAGHGTRLCGTKHRRDCNYKASDLRKVNGMDAQYAEFINA